MTRGASLLLRSILLLAGAAAFGSQQQPLPSGRSHTYVSPIAPDLDVVTEVSLSDPYAGQQFCVVYRLRARGAVSAVDIDPQQYPGFWTEVVPVPPESPPLRRAIDGRPAYEFLLRQVIAFPLLEGDRTLPPLSLKIKRRGRLSSSRDDWDLAGRSEAVTIRVRPLPPPAVPVAGLPFVGTMEGHLTGCDDKGPAAGCLLEMQGTANLALFRAGDYLSAPEGSAVSARLNASDKVVQTLDVEGQRRLSLTQRQQWAIRLLPGKGEPAIGDIVIPLFRPDDGKWDAVRIDGTVFPRPKAPAVLPAGGGPEASRGEAGTGAGSGRRRSFGLTALAVAGIVLLAAGLWKRAGLTGRRPKRSGRRH